MAAACNEGPLQMTELLAECDEEDMVREQREAAPLPLSRRLGGLARRRRVSFASASAGTLGLLVLAAALLSRQGGVTAAVEQATAEHEVEKHEEHEVKKHEEHEVKKHEEHEVKKHEEHEVKKHEEHEVKKHEEHEVKKHEEHEAKKHDNHTEHRNKTADKLAWVYRNKRKGEAWPSLFCWSHIEEWGGERTLLESQCKAKFGIFACNDFVVISRSKYPITLGPHPKNSSLMFKTWVNDLPPDRRGNPAAGDTTSSYVNARTFLVAWKTLMKSKVMWSHDWMIKCDPDAVFYPERLRWHVAKFSMPPNGPGPFYFMNCPIAGGRIYGALEVYSILAIQEMDKRGFECEAMPLDKWGEDLYMEQCMVHLNGRQNGIADYNLVGDSRCTQGGCNLGDRAAFHPFPNTGAYWGCASQAR